MSGSKKFFLAFQNLSNSFILMLFKQNCLKLFSLLRYCWSLNWDEIKGNFVAQTPHQGALTKFRKPFPKVTAIGAYKKEDLEKIKDTDLEEGRGEIKIEIALKPTENSW